MLRGVPPDLAGVSCPMAAAARAKSLPNSVQIGIRSPPTPTHRAAVPGQLRDNSTPPTSPAGCLRIGNTWSYRLKSGLRQGVQKVHTVEG